MGAAGTRGDLKDGHRSPAGLERIGSFRVSDPQMAMPRGSRERRPPRPESHIRTRANKIEVSSRAATEAVRQAASP